MLPPKTGRGRRALQAAMWIGAALLMAESIFGERGFTAMIEARKQHHAMQSSLDQLRAENAALRSRARRLREDPEPSKKSPAATSACSPPARSSSSSRTPAPTNSD